MSNARDTAKNLKTGLNVAADGPVIDIQRDGTSAGNIAVRSAGSGVRHLRIGNDDIGLEFHKTNNAIYPANITAGTLPDNTTDLGASNIRFKDIYTSGGIYLGAASNSTPVAANYLDDYEEGTWTPTLPNGGNITNNYSSYVKIGSLVHAYSYTTITSVPNDTGSFRVGGLPFNSTNNGNYFAGGSLSYVGSNNAQDWSDPLVYYGNNFIYFHKTDADGASVRNNQVQGTWPLILTVNYHTH
tara:strand:+ start:1299 stop:2024 length:726 start_codon:yes stop_codon:yes gene_type:complete